MNFPHKLILFDWKKNNCHLWGSIIVCGVECAQWIFYAVPQVQGASNKIWFRNESHNQCAFRFFIVGSGIWFQPAVPSFHSFNSKLDFVLFL